MATKTREVVRPVDKLLNNYTDAVGSRHKVLHALSSTLVVFGILGLVWAIPFPYLKFLGIYNGFVNWATFLIGVWGYYYYRLSPLLGYGLILIVFGFSAAIVGIEKLHAHQGWPHLWVVSLLIVLAGLAGQFIAQKIEGRGWSLRSAVAGIVTGPLSLIHALFVKARLRY